MEQATRHHQNTIVLRTQMKSGVYQRNDEDENDEKNGKIKKNISLNAYKVGIIVQHK